MGEFDEPFIGTDAVAERCLTSHRLRGMRRLHRNVYIHPDAEVTPLRRARAAWLWAGGDGVLTGWSAGSGARQSLETCTVDGMRLTTPVRTCYDLARWLPVAQAVEHLDSLCRATALDPAAILRAAAHRTDERGLEQLRTVVPLVDPGAESLPETRVRLLLVVRVNSEQLRTRPSTIVERVRRRLRDAGARV